MKYKVKALHISGLGKKQHHSGESVTDKDFTEGRAAELCEQGYLVKDEKSKSGKSKDEKPKDKKPKDEKPKDEKPKDEKPKDEKPKDEKPKDEKPKDEK